MGSALTKHPVASQIWTHDSVYANRLKRGIQVILDIGEYPFKRE